MRMTAAFRNFTIFLLLILVSAHTFSNPALKISDFIREPDFRSVSISPNGKYLATLRNQGKIRSVEVRDISQPNNPVIGYYADPIRRPKSLMWAADDRILVNIEMPLMPDTAEREIKSKKDFNIYDYFLIQRTFSLNEKLEDPVVLLNDDYSVRNNVNLSYVTIIKKNTKDVLITALRSNFTQLYKVDIYTGKSQRIARGSKWTYNFLVDHAGNPQYRLDYFFRSNKVVIHSFISEKKWDKFDTIDFDKPDNEEQEGLTLDDLVKLGGKGDNLFYIKENEESGFNEILKYNSKTKEHDTVVSLSDKDVEGMLTNNLNDLIGYWTQEDLIQRHYFDPELQKINDAAAKKIGNYNFYAPELLFKQKSVVLVYGSNMPGSYFLYDKDSNKLQFIQNRYLNLSRDKLAIPAKTTVKTRDNLEIESLLLLPPGYEEGQSYPLVILPHGGPQARDVAFYDDFAQFIATRGYVVAQPNFRGSTGYGKKFEELGYKQWGLKMQDDLVDTANFLIRKGYANKDKVCIVGASYGGYAALIGSIKTEDIFKCSISINGVTDLREQAKHFVKNAELQETIDFVHKQIGHPNKDKKLLEENSPALHADKFKTPVLIIAGENDETVPYTQSKSLVKSLRKMKKEVKFVTLKNAGHNPFVYYKHKKKVYTEIEKFLAKYL
ncbi:Dipeptidyl aminopeptidase BIII [Thalassocella blandensis]|nr:Dipeptidyl aminopeptidase BIII [Thalassocella blandensis]